MGKLASWPTFLCQLIVDRFPMEPRGRKHQRSVVIIHLIQIKSVRVGQSFIFLIVFFFNT